MKLVIAMTAGFSSMRELQAALDLIYEFIFDRLENKKLPIPGDAIPLVNQGYSLLYNPHGLSEQAFVEGSRGQPMELQLIYKDSKRNARLPYSFAEPVYTKAVFTKDLADHEQTVVTYAAWETGHRLKLTLYYIETPYIVTYTLSFPDDCSTEVQFRINVSLAIPDFTAQGTRNPQSLLISG